MNKLLLVGDLGLGGTGFLHDRGLEVKQAENFEQALQAVNSEPFDIVVIDLESLGRAAMYVLDQASRHQPAAYSLAAADLRTLRGPGRDSGACDILLRKPLSRRRLLESLARFLENPNGAERMNPDSLIGISSGIRKFRHSMDALADCPHPILLTGETGTGKSLVAHALSAANPARKGPFVTVDCGSISPTLLENELFGHARGAYTGADNSQRGLIEAADGGTVFFDEIGELPLPCQSRLLRFLQEREIRPLGDTKTVKIDARTIAATNVDLRQAVQDKRFREDLFYRLSVVTLELPPLRERKDDIPVLADHFIRINSLSVRLSLHAHARLMEYHWPGNVRELQNRLLRASAFADGQVLKGTDIFESSFPIIEPALGTLHDLEKQAILKAVDETNHDIIAAARRLGIGKTTLYRRLKAYGI